MSKIPAPMFVDCLQVVQKCGGVGALYHQNSMVYKTLVAGHLYTEIVKCDGMLEYFADGMWKQQACLNPIVHEELAEALARVRPMDKEWCRRSGNSNEPKYYLGKLRAPISDGNFVKQVAKHL